MADFIVLLPAQGLSEALLSSELPRECRLAIGASPFLIADARLDNVRELGVELGLGSYASTSDVLQAGWQRWGASVVDHLSGDFALARWEPSRRQLFVARDHMGVRPLYLGRSSFGAVVSTDLGALVRFPGVDLSPDEGHVAEMLIDWWHDHEATFFQGIRRLPGGHRAWICEKGLIRQERYWRLSLDELHMPSDQAYEEHFRYLFEQAVQQRVEHDESVAVEISGGLDSSTVAGLLQQLIGSSRGLTALACSFADPRYDGGRWDEGRYRSWLRDLPGVRFEELPATDALSSEAIDSSIRSNHGPIGGGMFLVRQHLYRRAAAGGATAIFDGLDGDSTVGYGHERLTSLFWHAHWPTFLREVRAIRRRLGIGRAARASISNVVMAPVGWASWQLGRQSRSLTDSLASGDLLRETKTWNLVRPLGAARPDNVRISHRTDICAGVHPLSLEVSAAFEAACDLAPRHPYYDRRLTEFALSLPDDQLFRGGVSRSIQRRALRGYAPEHVLQRTDKGAVPDAFISDLLAVSGIEEVALSGGGLAAPFVDREKLWTGFQNWKQTKSPRFGYPLYLVVLLHRWLATGESGR